MQCWKQFIPNRSVQITSGCGRWTIACRMGVYYPLPGIKDAHVIADVSVVSLLYEVVEIPTCAVCAEMLKKAELLDKVAAVNWGA